MLFVAITRATHWVYVSALAKECNESMHTAMKALQSRRRAVLQTKADLPRKAPTPTPSPKGDWTDI
jgi:hypothetical protein